MSAARERLDVYDVNKKRTGKTALRGERLLSGERFLYTSVWVMNSSGELLVTLRSMEKEFCPGLWENTGGAVLAGETSAEGCSRELYEETGISAPADALKPLETHVGKVSIMDAYFLRCDIPAENIRLQPGETDAAKWVSLAEFEEMCCRGEVAKPIAEGYERVKRALAEFITNG